MSASVRRCASPASAADFHHFILQRSGARPLRFNGILLACSDEACAPLWSRLRLALYRRDEGGYVCEMVCVPGDHRRAGHSSPPSMCHVVAATTLEAALQQFETIAAGMTDTVSTAAPADAAGALFHAASRLCRATAEDRVLRREGGRFLYRLCLDLGAS
jgi:hypothetical protein